jgi:hypothetical protein
MATEDRASNDQTQSEEVKVLSGRPVWIDSTNDCYILRHICLLPGAWNILGEISQGKRHIKDFAYVSDDPPVTLTDVANEWDKLLYGRSPAGKPEVPTEIDSRLASFDDDRKLLHLFGALNILHDVWDRDAQQDKEDKKDGLRGLLVLPSGSGQAEIELDTSGLVIHPGSLAVEFAWKARYAATYVLALVTRRGRVESQIADDIVKRLRERMSGHKLPTPSTISEAELSGKLGMIIFLHGLMSTDAGLFDPLIDELNDDPTFQKNFLMLGYPHDSFSKIETNAGDLLDRLAKLLRDNATMPLAFVAHSRGGVLARAVAVGLYDMNPSRWRTQLAGCVTFGTPHYGTPLAEYPSKLLGIGVTAIGAQSGGFASASDVLALVQAYAGEIPGISDLRSPSAMGVGVNRYNFITELREKERRFGGRENCILPMLAIGGKGPHNNRIRWMTDKMFRGVDNDCAVELASSAPQQISNCTPCEVQSDHFSYFQNKIGFDKAIGFIDTHLNHSRKIGLPKQVVIRRPRRAISLSE